MSLATLDGNAMRLLVSTQQDTPFSDATDRGRLARRLPMLTSAVGLAYLAFCPVEERDTLLHMLRPAPDPADQLSESLATIAAQGYAPSPPMAGETAIGFAVPLRSGADVLGCVTLRYFGKALSEAQVAARYLTQLQEMAGAIAANYRLARG